MPSSQNAERGRQAASGQHPGRRDFLRQAGALGACVPLAGWVGCGGRGETSASAPATGAIAADPNGTIAAAIDASRWASGGTAAMAAAYPDPFTALADSTCAATCQATAGPCYLEEGLPPARSDVSEGQLGLPVHLGLRLVDGACSPIAGAQVEIWHTNASGIYSGQTPNPAFCSASKADAIAADYCRGVQTTGADGKVFFRTVFPGWYTSRTIHIHVRVRIGGTLSLTTQFFFDDAIDDAIVGQAPIYKERGSRDTTNKTDTVVSAEAAPTYCFDVQQLQDGVMQAWKTIAISTAQGATVCTIPAGSTAGASGGQSAPDGMAGSAPPASGRGS